MIVGLHVQAEMQFVEQRILPPDFDRNTKLGPKGEAVAAVIFVVFCVIAVGAFAWLGMQG